MPANVECKNVEEEDDSHVVCPIDDNPIELIYFPSKIRCDWYYLCVKGKAHRLECAPGYHYNEKTYQCDKPEIANCQVGA